MTDMPTNPTTAVATIRRAAADMRELAQAAIGAEGRDRWHVGATKTTRSPVIVDDDEQPTVLVETWAARYEAVNAHLVAIGSPVIAPLVADVLDALADDIVRTTEDGELRGLPPAEWTAAYNLAAAYLERRPQQ